MRARDEQKELAIKEKAIEMIVKDGFDGLSMHKLAKAAGVSPATIYIYYKDKEDLILQLSIEEWEKMGDATLKDFDAEMHFDEGLKVQWLNRANYCIENPINMHFLEQIRHSPYHDKIKSPDSVFVKTMGRFVKNAIDRKELIELPLAVYWSVAFAPMYQLVKFHMSPKKALGLKKFELTEEILQQTIELVLKALRP